jgi:hypothetical protein
MVDLELILRAAIFQACARQQLGVNRSSSPITSLETDILFKAS